MQKMQIIYPEKTQDATSQTPNSEIGNKFCGLSKEYKRVLIAKILKQRMVEKKIKNADLAEMLNKKPSEISRLLSGNYNFTLDTLSDFEEKLDISVLNLGLATVSIAKPTAKFSVEIKFNDSESSMAKYAHLKNVLNKPQSRVVIDGTGLVQSKRLMKVK
jgi:transcriptional regulator with XRE-family HTH domain